MTSPFAVTYAPELAQYVVERAGMCIRPTPTLAAPDARVRATALCVALNRVYSPSLSPAVAGAAHYDDGSPRNLAWGENNARWGEEVDALQDADTELRGAGVDLAPCACGHEARWHIAGRCFGDAETPCDCEEYAP